MGYQDMPDAAYKRWLKSLEVEKKKQAMQELNEKMQREIERLKRLKTKFANSINNKPNVPL